MEIIAFNLVIFGGGFIFLWILWRVFIGIWIILRPIVIIVGNLITWAVAISIILAVAGLVFYNDGAHYFISLKEYYAWINR